jgi:hypothetical protein
VHLEPKSVPIETQRGVEIRDGDANVIEDSFHAKDGSSRRTKNTKITKRF